LRIYLFTYKQAESYIHTHSITCIGVDSYELELVKKARNQFKYIHVINLTLKSLKKCFVASSLVNVVIATH
jgi:hypothetical protein